MEAGLYVVATPMGNFGDLSSRAIETLSNATLIAAEDTRHSKRLLYAFEIDTPLMAYHDHSDDRALLRIAQCIETGGAVALISDAGTPLISDPGYRLVRYVQDRGHSVRPVPGACAAIAALSVAGLPTDRFMFEGFLPARQAARRKRLEALREASLTLVIYEAPHRIQETLTDLHDILGPAREALLAREMTKTFETLRRAPLAELVAFVGADAHQRKGEFVLVVEGAPPVSTEIDALTRAWLERLVREMPAKRAAAVVADVTGMRKKLLYEYLIGK